MLRIASCLVTPLLVTASASASVDTAVTGAWSASVDGVRARLVVTPYVDAQKHAQLDVAVDLDNTSDLGVPITIAAGVPSQMFHLTLEDARGAPVAMGAVGGNEMTPPAFVLALPPHATLHWTIAQSAYEYVPNGRVMLRPFTFTAWDIPAQHDMLYLKATLHPVTTNDVHGDWKGPLTLPRVALP